LDILRELSGMLVDKQMETLGVQQECAREMSTAMQAHFKHDEEALNKIYTALTVLCDDRKLNPIIKGN
jgi:hypothetical protein